MRQSKEQKDLENECTVYIRFPCQGSEVDEDIIRKLFGQFGGLSQLSMKPENNYAFATYEKPHYSLYVCELLNGISFMNGTLVVKPRDKTRNSELFQYSAWAKPRYQQPFTYGQLDPMRFDGVNPEIFLRFNGRRQEER